MACSFFLLLHLDINIVKNTSAADYNHILVNRVDRTFKELRKKVANMAANEGARRLIENERKNKEYVFILYNGIPRAVKKGDEKWGSIYI